MEIVHPAIEAYLASRAPETDPVLLEMERIASERDFPIVGPLVGRLLCQYARLLPASRILELGSGYGYSAYWFARGLVPKGEIVCTDGSVRHAEMAREFFRRGKVQAQLTFEVGDAVEIIENFPGPFDIIFVDIDKEQYPAAFPKTLSRLRPGGLLITDNVLWDGRVLEEDPVRESTQGVKEYTRLLYSTPELFTTIIPVRDGLSVSLKVG